MSEKAFGSLRWLTTVLSARVNEGNVLPFCKFFRNVYILIIYYYCFLHRTTIICVI